MKKTEWIIEAGKQRISRYYYRLKQKTRMYVCSPVEEGGYGLTSDLSPKARYEAANRLLTDRAFLYAGGSTLTGAVPSNLHTP